jgi:6-phosphogluconolactonase (cycloisomerase 2 family)
MNSGRFNLAEESLPSQHNSFQSRFVSHSIMKIQKICFPLCLLLLPGVAGLTGCGFFPPINNCTTNCTTSTDFLYVANTTNTTTTPASVAGFSLTTTTTAATATAAATSTLSLAITPGSAYSLGFVPTALAITPGNKFLYVSALTGGIYLYAINTNGSITIQNNSQPVVTGSIVSTMKVDSTGAWLIVANASLSTTKAVVTVYSIASTTGLLTSSGTLAVSTAGASNRMVIAPSNTNVYLTLGTGGTEAFTFNATNGVLADVGNLAPLSAANADQGIATDPSSVYVFVTETGTGGVRVLKIGTSPALAEVAGSPFATGVGPSAVLVDSSGSYVYVTNRTDNTISGYVLAANGTLTAISGSPFATGTNPVDIAEDSTGLYVGVVCNGGGQDLEIYSFDATTGGKLDAAANATTGTDPTLPIAIAMTTK